MKLLVNTNFLDQYTSSFITVLIDYSPKIIAAALLLIIGIWGIKIINTVSRKIMIKRNIEPTLIEFLTDTMHWGLRILLFIAVISKLGIESSSFVAILGAAGLAVGLSLQGSLSNFAGGMLIILFKPFKLGDVIEAQNISGKVIDIQIFVTQVLTANNQVVFIPNGALSNGNIVNYSKLETRRTDLTISVSYETDIKKAKDLIFKILNENPQILQEPKGAIIVKELTDSGIKLAIQAWTKNQDYALVCAALLEDCKSAFDSAKIPFQTTVK